MRDPFPWNRENVSAFDLALISTAHDAVNYEQLAKWSRCIIDTRNAMSKIQVQNGLVWKA